MSGPYYEPENCGLEIVDSLSENLSYEFNMLVVWRDKVSGLLFYGMDFG